MTYRNDYREEDGSPRAPYSQIEAMYLRAAALDAGDHEAAALFEDEAEAFARRDLEDERAGA